MASKSYDSKKYIISISGVQISGFPDGEKITFTSTSEQVRSFVGSDSTVEFVDVGDPRWDCTLNLQQTSSSNDYMSSLGTGLFTFALTDLNGSTFAFGEGKVTKSADATAALETTTRAWTLQINVSGKFIGGSPVALVAPV